MSRRTLDPAAIEQILLLRVVASGNRGIAMSALRRELWGLLRRDLSAGAWRKMAENAVAGLMRSGAVGEGRRGRLVASSRGRAMACGALGIDLPRLVTWTEVRDHYLIAKALAIAPREWKARAAQLATADGLRVAILEQAFALEMAGPATPASIRSALAAIALARGFGEPIKARLGASPELPGRAGRAIAAELLKKPRSFLNDRGLIAALAAECVGAAKRDAGALRAALLARLLLATEAKPQRKPDRAGHQQSKDRASRRPARPAVNGVPRGRTSGPAARPVTGAPEIAGFAAAVAKLASLEADGWAGNRKAYISHVWRSVRASHPEWDLDVTAFKSLLSEAHREGHLVLANADLRDQKNIADIRESAVRFKNMEWHFIRVTDETPA